MKLSLTTYLFWGFVTPIRLVYGTVPDVTVPPTTTTTITTSNTAVAANLQNEKKILPYHPLVDVCMEDKIIHDELTALLAQHDAVLMMMMMPHQDDEEEVASKLTIVKVGRRRHLNTDHRSKYYRNPFQRLCIATGYCNPFATNGGRSRRNLRGDSRMMMTMMIDHGLVKDTASPPATVVSTCDDGSIHAIKEGLKNLASKITFADGMCQQALNSEFVFDCDE